MERFLNRHQDDILGTLSGYDRILFRGTLRSISYVTGMQIFVSSQGVLFKNYQAYVERLTEEVVVHAKQYAEQSQRPYIHVKSPNESKEELVRELLREKPVREGLICVLGCVEPCHTWSVRFDKNRQGPFLRYEPRQCLYLYLYLLDPEFGLMHIRLQSWVPFNIQVCLNGREYLARQMTRKGLGFEQHDNCFTRLDDLARAQELSDKLESYDWNKFLDPLAQLVNPLLKKKKGGLKDLKGYYWSVRQSEYATDILFRDQPSLDQIYPSLTRHAIEEFGSEDVLRFLGRRTNSLFSGRNEGSLKRRVEGVRVKHYVEENSIKMYNKAGSVLRIETTINNPRRFRVRRQGTSKGKRVMKWQQLRKGVADFRRRSEIARSANKRYLDALAVVGQTKPSHQLFDAVSKRIEKDGRAYRALRPVSPEDSRLFEVILGGEFSLQGFRNRDIRERLEAQAEADPREHKRACGRITRLLRLLVAHNLIYKVVHTNYYRITKKGHEIMSTAIRFRNSEIALLAA
jgi:hypothetical protein